MRAPRIRAVAGKLADVVRDGGAPIDVLALPVGSGDDGPQPTVGVVEVAHLLGIDLDATFTRERFRGSEAEVVRVPWAPGPSSPNVERVVLVGVGQGSRRRCVWPPPRSLARTVGSTGWSPRWAPAAAPRRARWSRGSCWARTRRRALGCPRARVPRCGASTSSGRLAPADLEQALVVAEAAVLARDLAQTPSSTKGPAWVAGRARRVAAEVGLTCTVRDHKQLRDEGFGGLLAVGGAAQRPPRLVELGYTPAETTARTPARRARRQGDHLRHRRHLAQAARVDDLDEDRHDRRRSRRSPC